MSSEQNLPSVMHTFIVDVIPVKVLDFEASKAAKIVARELQQDHYELHRIQFRANDVVIDVGGHIGLFSIYLGLSFPEIIIHAFEPFPDNYRLFERNLAFNMVTNVRLHPEAITGDGRQIAMATNPTNSGGATCNSATLSHRRVESIPSVTLDHVFESLGIKKCKLLKIDCEGCEYEILQSTRVLSRVEHLRGEFHVNRLLTSRGYSVERMLRYCAMYIHPEKTFIKSLHMSE